MSALVSVSLVSACSVVAKPLLLRDIFHFITPVIVDQGEKIITKMASSDSLKPKLTQCDAFYFKCV